MVKLLLGLVISSVVMFSQSSWAQSLVQKKSAVKSKTELKSTTPAKLTGRDRINNLRRYHIATKRTKPKKFVYHAETTKVQSMRYGQMLPSQVTLDAKTHAIEDRNGGTVGLKTKAPQRGIASVPAGK